MNKIEKGYITSVLDKGYVKLIDYMGNDLSPIESARMSTDNPTGVDEDKDDKLRDFLWKNSHSSPFESLILVVEMKLPIVVLRELDRHRSIDIDNTIIDTQSDFRKYNSRNEFSGRYAEMPNEYYVPSLERIQKQSTTNKQGSYGEIEDNIKNWFQEYSKTSADESYKNYKQFIEHDIAREVARFNLPLSQYTKVRVSANFTNWAKFLKLRLALDAQWEIRQYAQAIEAIIKELWPKTYNVFIKYSLNSKSFTANEIHVLANVVRLMTESDRNHHIKEYMGKVQAKQLFTKLNVNF